MTSDQPPPPPDPNAGPPYGSPPSPPSPRQPPYQPPPAPPYQPNPPGYSPPGAPPAGAQESPPPYAPPAGQPPYAPPPGQPPYAPPAGQPPYAPSAGQPQYGSPQPSAYPPVPPAGQQPYAPPPGESPYPAQSPTGQSQYGQPTSYGAPAPSPYPAGGGAPWAQPGEGSAARVDPKSIHPLDWGIIAAGLLAFIFSFFAFYSATATANLGGTKQSFSDHASAWNEIFGGGFFGWIAMVFAVAGAVLLAVGLLVPNVNLPVPLRTAVLGLFALAAICELLALLIHPKFTSVSGPGFSASVGHGVGYWLSLIVILVGLVLSFLRLRATGGSLPWEKSATA